MKKSKKRDDGAEERLSDGHILIKKYPNRRLYNTATSTYIVLDDVIELVKSGQPFVIEDTKSGEDITRTILNQIIFEQEIKPSNFHFPLEFQKQLIAMYGDTYGQMVPDYLTESLKLFAAERSQMGHAFESVVDRNTRTMMEYSQKLAQQNMEMFRQSWSMFNVGSTPPTTDGSEPEKPFDASSPPPSSPSSSSSSPPPSPPRENELEQIQKQIDALQARLKSLK
ncbi:MAG: polyhydroxyalkanoate synthesis repressor PhaR [Rhizobiaceae bacterium]